MEQLWYNEKLDSVFIGRWVYKKHLFIFTKKYYLVEIDPEKVIVLSSPDTLQANCVFVGNL